MKKSLLISGVALAFGLSILTTAASAADSSGTYEGFIKCTIYNSDGTKDKTGKRDLIVLVNQGETDNGTSNLRMNFNFFAETLADGTQFDDANNSDKKAAVGAVGCGNNDNSRDFNFVTNANLTKADKEKAKLKGTASFTDNGENGTCKWNATRTTVPPPDLESC